MTQPVDSGASRAGGMHDPTHDELSGRSLSTLGETIGHISQDLSDLIRQETMLAKAELAASARRGGKGAGMLAGAGVAGHFVLLFLSLALWWALGEHLIGLGWSAVVVAVIWAVVAATLALLGRKTLKDVQGIPQTVETTKEIPDALKGNEDHR